MIWILFVLVSPSHAHSARHSGNTSGLAIPNLTHGQLHIMQDFETAILSLANRQVQPSLDARTLQNFVNLQSAYCLWGLVPGSLSDETSPFNECSHAYLAATRELLGVLRKSEDTRDRADALAAEIDLAMRKDSMSLAICGHSFEPFNTAEIVMPSWSEVTFNPLGILLGVFIFGVSAVSLAVARSGRRVGSSG